MDIVVPTVPIGKSVDPGGYLLSLEVSQWTLVVPTVPRGVGGP